MAGKQIQSSTFPNLYDGRKRRELGAEEERLCLVAVTNSRDHKLSAPGEIGQVTKDS